MRNKTIMTAAVLALTLTTAAARAQYPQYRSDRYPDRNQTDRVTSVAYELGRTAISMQREYDRNNRRPDRDEARVALQLRALADESSRFYNDMGRYRRDPRQTQRGIERLLQVYDRTADSLRYIDRRGYVDRGMDRMGDLLTDLARAYGVSDWHRDRYDRDGHGRYDRDRRGGYDRDGRGAYDQDNPYDRQDDRDDQDGWRPPQS